MFERDDRFGRGDGRAQPMKWRRDGLGCHRFAFDGIELWTQRPTGPQTAEGMEDPHRAMRELCGLGY